MIIHCSRWVGCRFPGTAQKASPQIRLEGPAIDYAKDPSTSQAILEQLAQSNELGVREAVARNPNSPWSSYLLLFEELSEAILENPSFPLLLLEEPGRFHQLSVEGLCKALQRPSFPEEYLGTCGAHPVEQVRATLVKSAWISPRFLEGLSRDRSSSVRAQVARHPLLSEECREQLSRDLVAEVRCGVLENPRLPTARLLEFAADPSPLVQLSLASHRDVTAKILVDLFDDASDLVREAIARHHRTPYDLLRLLATADREPSIREVARRNLRRGGRRSGG